MDGNRFTLTVGSQGVHSLRDTRPLVVSPPTLAAPPPDPVIHDVLVPVTLRMTCVAAG